VYLGLCVKTTPRDFERNSFAFYKEVFIMNYVRKKTVLFSYLSVTFSTIGADVGLDVLGLLMLGDVLKERLFVGKALVAGVALVWLVCLVAPGVGLQVGQL
jgi:hypothetical protein